MTVTYNFLHPHQRIVNVQHFDMDTSAAELYLLDRWNDVEGTPDERRTKIFREFTSLGQRGRWPWHAKTRGFVYMKEENRILDSCRTSHERTIWDWIGDDFHRLLFGDASLSDEELEAATGFDADLYLVCDGERYRGGQVFDFMPEAVYSMTAFDDPDDTAELKLEKDQVSWVSGVYWLYDDGLILVWCDEYGQTVRQKRVATAELEELDMVFHKYKHFESPWWLEAERVGKYAGEDWWKDG